VLCTNDHDPVFVFCFLFVCLFVFLLYALKDTISSSVSFPEGARVLPHLLKLIFPQFPLTISTVIDMASLCLRKKRSNFYFYPLHIHIVLQRGGEKDGGSGGARI